MKFTEKSKFGLAMALSIVLVMALVLLFVGMVIAGVNALTGRCS